VIAKISNHNHEIMPLVCLFQKNKNKNCHNKNVTKIKRDMAGRKHWEDHLEMARLR
jgi:hypothetical protein